MRRLVFLGCWLLFALLGCAPGRHSGAATYLLPWTNAQGGYSLEEVSLSTLDSPYQTKGAAAEVYYQPNFSDSGFAGDVAEPHLFKSGHVYIPRDVGSSLALAVYAQFERLYQYERAHGFAGQLSWPRKVGVELNLTVSGNTVEEHNNAHYFTDSDVIGLLPFSLSGNVVPFSLNQGIVAHEHFHAHFQSQVINRLRATSGIEVTSALENLFYAAFDRAAGITATDGDEDPHTPKFLNDIVMRGWNEGLADLFAALYTGRPEFFVDSAPSLAPARALDLGLTPMFTSAQMTDLAGQVDYNHDLLVALAYAQGTSLSRVLYRVATSGAMSKADFLDHLMGRLQAIPAAIRDGYTTRVMDVDAILPVLLDGVPLTSAACEDLQTVMTSTAFSEGFARCVGL